MVALDLYVRLRKVKPLSLLAVSCDCLQGMVHAGSLGEGHKKLKLLFFINLKKQTNYLISIIIINVHSRAVFKKKSYCRFGELNFLKNTSRYSFNLDGKTLRTLLVYLTSIILKEAVESNFKLFAFLDLA